MGLLMACHVALWGILTGSSKLTYHPSRIPCPPLDQRPRNSRSFGPERTSNNLEP